MSIGIQYNVAEPGGNITMNSVVGTVYEYARKTVRRHSEQSRLRAMRAGMSSVSTHTLKDIGVDRNILLSIATPATSRSGREASSGGRYDVGA